MDDIVTRLRNACVNLGDDLHDEAADEIERLRADRDRFEAIAEQAVKTLESAMAIIEQIQGAIHD